MERSDNNYGILLYENGWVELADVIEPYTQSGPIGKYLYCKKLEFTGSFVVLTFSKKQVNNEIKDDMSIWLPTQYIKFIAHASEQDIKHIGFF